MNFASNLFTFLGHEHAVVLERFIWLPQIVQQSVFHVEVIQHRIFSVFLKFTTTRQILRVVRPLCYF